MPNIAKVLKQEIARVAKKQMREDTAALRKANTQYRHSIAELKRRVDALTQQVGYLERQERKRAQSQVPEQAAEGRRFSARGLKAHRTKIGLSAAEYAQLAGVSTQTIYNWERGKARPRQQQLAALVELRELGKREAHKRLGLLSAS